MKIFGMVHTVASRDFTREALRSFFKGTTLAPEDKFFLIDNDQSFAGSEKGSYPITLLRNEAPLGFAQNVNQLIPRAIESGADLFFLNNDIIFPSGWIEPLLVNDTAILSPLSNREVQYAATVLVPKTNNVTSLFTTGIVMQLSDYTGNAAAVEMIAEANRKGSSNYWSVYVAPFFCVKIPHVVLNAVGRFDERFGKGGAEDYDYCLRARLAGFEVKFALGSWVLHFGGKSSYSGAETSEQQAARENKFLSAFKEKWGPKLHDTILREETAPLDSLPNRRERESTGELRSIISDLLENRPIEIKL